MIHAAGQIVFVGKKKKSKYILISGDTVYGQRLQEAYLFSVVTAGVGPGR
jgi:hypothetical protein